MILGIDASNIRGGGGLTHLRKILEYTDPELLGITKVIIWGGRDSLEYLPAKPWLDLREIRRLNQSLHKRLLWQQTELGKLSAKSCDLLFAPGGLYLGGFRPYVTMFQNMQIFETKERNREKFSRVWFRLRLLQSVQAKTFRESSGLICLSEYARNYLTQYHYDFISKIPVQIISHGSDIFHHEQPLSFKGGSDNQKILRILYVSTVKKYKHQWNLIDAVGLLSKEGASIELHLIGGGDTHALNLMKESLQRNDHERRYIFYHGSLPHEETLEWFSKMDIFVFPSTCENLPIILLEAMKAGLPIASSDRGPMPEVLKDAGLYFNPDFVLSIKSCLRYMIDNSELRQRLGKKAKQYSQSYSWKKCADETFSFLRSVYAGSKK